MIAHNRPTLDFEEEAAACRVVKSGWLAQGIEVACFEDEFCKFLGLPQGHAVAVSSGTAALFLALWALKAKGKKIGFPAYVCSALRNAAAMAGGGEILIDNMPDSPNMNLQQLAQSGAEIAVIPHMFGIPLDISGLGIDVIEDCAQAIGAMVNQVPVGLQGDLGIYSFYATKMITSGGQGGMVVSRNKATIDEIRDYRQFDQRRDSNVRFNFQMTDIQAAIGRVQLKKLHAFIARRSEIFEMYKDAGLPLLDIAALDMQRIKPVRYRAVLRTSYPQKLLTKLGEREIKCIVPIESWELLGEPSCFPQASKLTQETVSLPIYPSLSDQDINRVIEEVLQV